MRKIHLSLFMCLSKNMVGETVNINGQAWVWKSHMLLGNDGNIKGAWPYMALFSCWDTNSGPTWPLDSICMKNTQSWILSLV